MTSGVYSTVADDGTVSFAGSEIRISVRTRSPFDVHWSVLKLCEDRPQCLNCKNKVKHLTVEI